MSVPAPVILDLTGDLDALLAAAPDQPAVFSLWGREGQPYLARTQFLRRRLRRLLARRDQPSRILNLRDVAVRLEYHLTHSRLSASLTYYEEARRCFPDNYLDQIRLRLPAYVKVLFNNPFPRTTVTTRLSTTGLHFGPFRTRAAAERFEQDTLDLFQVRRCPEDLSPAPDHPGCLYGEMNRCLRPCQQVVSPGEYRAEVDRLSSFLHSAGASLLESLARSRDQLAAQLEFESAQLQHERYEKVAQLLRQRDELAHDIDALNGVAIHPSPQPGVVELRFLLLGAWLPAQHFSLQPVGEMIPLDRRLRELTSTLTPPKLTLKERMEHLALLARWFYSSWRDGEWLFFDNLHSIPYRQLVRALSRVARPRSA